MSYMGLYYEYRTASNYNRPALTTVRVQCLSLRGTSGSYFIRTQVRARTSCTVLNPLLVVQSSGLGGRVLKIDAA
eukprot:scaffold101898_cov17-Prasinocladus_malaysianus.AAC.1